MNFAIKGSSYSEERKCLWIFGQRKSWYYGFLEGTGDLFQRMELLSLLYAKLAWYFKKWEKWYFSSQKKKKKKKRRSDDIFLIFRRWKNTVSFEPKSWWKCDIYWLLKSSCLEYFRNGKYGLYLSQKVDAKMIFADYWKFLFLNFSVMGNTFFFQPKSW